MTRLLAAAAVLLVALTGCGGAPTSPVTPPTHHAPRSAVLGPTGHDGLEIGMTYAEAMATGDVAEEPGDPGGGPIPHLAGHLDAGLCLSKEDGLMAIFLGRGMHTPEGLRIGSSVADLVAAYPRARPLSDGALGQPGVFRADATPTTWYEIDVDRGRRVSTVILRQDHQTCFE